MSHKSQKIATAIEPFQGQALDAHLLGYLDCFNRQLFFEAHDVLEELWLPHRHGAEGLFYQGLIQLAGAFVHLQKNRLRPAASLFALARANLSRYPATHQQVDLKAVLNLIDEWSGKLESTGFSANPLSAQTSPKLQLEK